MIKKFNKNIANVIIIGAGPSGAIAAATLAEAGIKTFVLEKNRIVGMPLHCGEGISHYVLDFLGFDDKRAWVVKKMEGTKIFFPNRKFLYYPEQSYCINRTLFDQELVENAIKKGAQVLLKKTIVDISNRQGQWHVSAANGDIFKSHYVIAADGALSTVRRLFGLRENVITAIQYKFRHIERFASEDFIFYNNEKYHPGYSWIFDRGTETSIGVVGTANVKKKLENFIQSLDIDPTQKKSVHCGTIPYPPFPMSIVLPGILFAGDAGGFICPLTVGGVIGALMSGRIAGEVIRDALNTRQPQLLLTYPERVKLHPSRSKTSLFFSHKFFSLNNNSLNVIGDVINQCCYSDIPLLKALSGFFRKPSWQTVNALMIGYAAQQILRHYKRFIF